MMRWVQERAPTPCRDIVDISFYIAGIVVTIATEDETKPISPVCYLRQALHVGEVSKRRQSRLSGVHIGPIGLPGAQDQIGVRRHPFARDMSEEVDLALVDVPLQLDI